jgi:cobalt-zinc-cadmium efflux system outer membrane protein
VERQEVTFSMSPKRLVWMLGLLLLSGCYSSVRQNVDALICDRASHLVDLEPAPPSKGPAGDASASTPSHSAASNPTLRQVAAEAMQEKGEPLPTTMEKRLKVPQEVPGAKETPPLVLPALKEKPLEVLKEVARKYLPSPGPMGTDPGWIPGPGGRPLTLADLQHLARTNSPLLREAASDIEATRGAAIQAGAYPNPTIGLTAQTQGPGGGPNYGTILSQTIKTPGKLKLAQAAALMDLENARLAYRRAETDLSAAVRSGYFAVLVAQESIKANRGLVLLTDEVYRVMVDQFKVGEVATYEPMQVGVFAAQARASLIVARNSYTLAWQQLAATLGLPGMRPTEVAGRLDIPVPVYRYDKALARVLSSHTDVLTASNGIEKARFNLRLAELTPYPDVTLSTTVFSDVTPAGDNRIVTIGQVSVPVPLWDRNQGAIHQASAALFRANEEPHRVRDDLTSRLADAFRRYDENRDLLQLNLKEILPKQIQAFRAAVKRHYGAEPDKVAYSDLVTAEQNLVGVIGPYLTVLGALWQAVVDVANLLQTDDLFQLAEEKMAVAPLPDLDELLKLPCCHPCNPLRDPALRGGHGAWPPAGYPPASTEPSPPKDKEKSKDKTETHPPARDAVQALPAVTTKPGASLAVPPLEGPRLPD